MRHARKISEREIACALVLELAQEHPYKFSLLRFYDRDIDFFGALAERLSAVKDRALLNKVTRVTRRLVRYGVLYGVMSCTQKEFVGEPTKQMSYGFASPFAHARLTRGKTEHTGTPEWEAQFLVRRAYQFPDHSNV